VVETGETVSLDTEARPSQLLVHWHGPSESPAALASGSVRALASGSVRAGRPASAAQARWVSRTRASQLRFTMECQKFEYPPIISYQHDIVNQSCPKVPSEGTFPCKAFVQLL
jgi:hypothetical protein